MHGARGGAPEGKRNGNYKHGARVVIYMVDLEPQRQSTFGQYVKKMMTHRIEAIRLGGDIVMVLGAWSRSLPLIGVGLAIVIAGWLSGIEKTQRQ
jgi:hypothetical protein